MMIDQIIQFISIVLNLFLNHRIEKLKRINISNMLSKITLVAGLVVGVLGASPDGPSQQCADDSGPLWADDEEVFGDKAYSYGTPASPVLLSDEECPNPLKDACATKGPQRAFLEGPIECSSKGWFCRILPQDGWRNPDYSDMNFAHCNATDADERDNDGHCHGSDTDNVYGWWIRDHWFRGYAGTLHCCCDWELTKGLVNRCDYRKPINSPAELATCRDANEEHNKGYEGTCGAHSNIPYNDPVTSGSGQCWTIHNFADPESVPNADVSASSSFQNYLKNTYLCCVLVCVFFLLNLPL